MRFVFSLKQNLVVSVASYENVASYDNDEQQFVRVPFGTVLATGYLELEDSVYPESGTSPPAD